jgi:cyclase
MPYKRAAFGVIVVAGSVIASTATAQSAIGEVQQLASDVYFYEGDISKGHCNNGWVIFEDYVLAIDANYPSGAREVIAKIREQTKKPVRFAFDTDHHGDHAYGNQNWVDKGATPVAHTGVLEEMNASRPLSCTISGPATRKVIASRGCRRSGFFSPATR